MTHFDDRLLKDLEEQMEQGDPQFAQALDSGRPRRPREYRHGPAWLALAVALAMLVTGMVLPNGLVIAAGLIVAGMAGHLFDPHRDHTLGRSYQRLRPPEHGNWPVRSRRSSQVPGRACIAVLPPRCGS